MTSIDELLLGSDPDASGRMVEALRKATGFEDVVRVRGMRVPLDDVAASIRALLGMPIGDVAVRAWGTHHRVRKARERTRVEPGSREVVHLFGHKIRSRQSPRIEAEAGGVTVPVVSLDLVLQIKVAEVDLIVTDGSVTRIAPGRSRAKGTLAAAGITLAKRKFTVVDLGVPLQDDTRRPDRKS